jgi:hypothetical protein
VRASAANRAHGSWLQLVRRAPDAQRASIQDVGVDHRRADIRVPEEFLNRSNVGAAFEQMGRNECRNVWQLTRFVSPVRRTAAVTAR